MNDSLFRYSDIYNFDKKFFFIFISSIYVLLAYVTNVYILNDSLIYISLQDKLSIDRIENIINTNKNYEWVTYVLIPLLLAFKLLITTSVIFIGIKIFDFEISYSNCIKIVMLSESIFLIASFFKTFYFYLYPPINIEAIQNFVPFGISNILYSVSIPKYLNVLLQYISLFEICYWLFLAFGIKIFGNINFKKSLKIICLSYGAAMLIWCIFIVFIQLQFN